MRITKSSIQVLVALAALSLTACQNANSVVREHPKPTPVPKALAGEVIVKLSPSEVKRAGALKITQGLFGLPNIEQHDEQLVKGEMTVNGKHVNIYIPDQGPYELTSKEDAYKDTSMRVSVDADNNGELPNHESWFSSLPVRIEDSMFKVSAVDPGGTWIKLAGADQPLTGMVIGKPCPPFEFRTTDGKKTALADYKGKSLLLDIWSMT